MQMAAAMAAADATAIGSITHHAITAEECDRLRDAAIRGQAAGVVKEVADRLEEEGRVVDRPMLLLSAGDAAATRLALKNRLAGPIDGAELDVVCAADVTIRPVDWLWRPRIAIGKVTMFAGEPGLGKSQLVGAELAAIVTAGKRWPLTTDNCEPGDVLILSAEDDPEDTIVPRAKAAGADLKRLRIVRAVVTEDRDGIVRRRGVNLLDDLETIEKLLVCLERPRLIVVDPLSAYLSRGIDSHNNAEMRALLAPCSEMAARCRVALVCVSHLNKATGQRAMNRVIGSIAQVAAARAAYLIARESDDSPRRLMVPLKNNLGVDRGGYAFEIEPVQLDGGISTSRVRWADSAVDVTADDLLAAETKPAGGTALDEACQFLATTLEHGEVAHKQLEQAAARAGIAWRTVERASKALDVHKRKERGKGGRWLWSLSAQDQLK